MYIRYQYVRNFFVGVTSLSVFSLCGWGMCMRESPPEPAPEVITASAPEASSSAPSKRPASSTSTSGAPTDAAILARAESTAEPKGKIKDAFPGPVKVNIYEDSGDAVWDRIKIDRQRDEVWDEQWVRKGGQWLRDEDGKRWDGAGWSDGSAPAASDKGAPAAELAELVELMTKQRATSEKIKDLKRGSGPKINVYDDNKDGQWDRAKVDHDRDEKWDESWTFKGGQVERKKEADGKVYLFKDGAWVPK